jgi:hypothetical protein
MASRILVVFENGEYKGRASSAETLDFTSIKIGASGLEIKETGGHFDFSAKKLTNLAEPTAASDAATKAYADAVAGGFDPKDSVDLATVAALPACTYDNGTGGVGATLTADANGALSVDGVAVTVGDRILVKDQASGLQNGIYDVTATGDGSNPFVLTRSTDFDDSPDGEVTKGARTSVIAGNTKAGWVYYLSTATAITIGTTALTFSVLDSTPTATSASAGGTIGKVTADSDKGLAITAGVMEVKHDGEGLAFSGGSLALELDGSTLSKSGTGVKVADAGITGTQLASSVAGAGLTGGAGSALAVGAGDGIKVSADAVARDDAKTFTNDNAGAITVRQVAYVKANGNVDLADADLALGDFALGVVEDASIASAGSGKIVVRPGAIIGGFSGMTPGKRQYVSATAGGLTETAPSGSGQSVYKVGRALSATELLFEPEFILSIA